MNPGAFASRFLTGSIAFTGITILFIVLITFLGYSSDVMAVGTKRFFVTAVIFFFFASVIVAALILFPDLPTQVYNYLDRLGYR